jgi:hypothetical protein
MKLPQDIDAIKRAIEEAQDLTVRKALKKTLKQLEKAGNEPAQRGRPGLDKAGNEPRQRKGP